jgi:hypothetical protein
MDNKSSTSSRSPEDVEGEPVAKKSRLVHKTIIYDESKANQWLDEPPLEVWDHHIIPLLSLKDLALARPVCTFFEAYWQEKFSNNVLPLRVGNDVATINDVMGVIEILSSRREYTKLNPFVVLLGKGDHQITSSCVGITCSNVTFIGQGIGVTTILGGLSIHNVQNITLKQMTVTNTNTNTADAIYIENAHVEIVDVAVKGFSRYALYVPSVTTSPTNVVAKRCQFTESSCGAGVFSKFATLHFTNCQVSANVHSGIFMLKGIIHLHGESTAVHSNGHNGIRAQSSGKVIIHLPSHHNTSYNNTRGDRLEARGGTITNVVN